MTTASERTVSETDAILRRYPESWWRVCPASEITESDLPRLSALVGHPLTLTEARECGCQGCIFAMNSRERGRGPTAAEFAAWRATATSR